MGSLSNLKWWISATGFKSSNAAPAAATILGNNEHLTLRWLTMKTIFLIAFSPLSRVSTISRLGSSIEVHPANIIVPIMSLEKQARVSKPDNIRGWLQLETFPEDERICPVRTLKYYLAKIIPLRTEVEPLLV